MDIEDLPFGFFTMDNNYNCIKERTLNILNATYKNDYWNKEKAAEIMKLLDGCEQSYFSFDKQSIIKIAKLDKELSSYVGKFFKNKYGVADLNLEEFINLNNKNNLQVFNSVPRDVAKECPKSHFFFNPGRNDKKFTDPSLLNQNSIWFCLFLNAIL